MFYWSQVADDGTVYVYKAFQGEIVPEIIYARAVIPEGGRNGTNSPYGLCLDYWGRLKLLDADCDIVDDFETSSTNHGNTLQLNGEGIL